MPYPNEHAARMSDPDKYVRLRRENDKFGPGIHAVWGVLSNGKTEVQSIRFDKSRFSPEAAGKWCEDHGKKPLQFEAAVTAASRYSLSADGAFQAPEGEPTDRQGHPVQRFIKDLIKVGFYDPPDKGWTLDVTTERMDRWIAAFRRMRAAGVDVEVVKDHSFKTEDVLGYILDIWREGDTLFAMHEMVGEDPIELAKRVKNVSIFLEDDYVDGKGRHYGEAISHSSLCQQPVVPDQQGFVPVAASSGSRDGRGYFLSRAAGNTHTEDGAMNLEQILAGIRKALGLSDADVTPENAVEKLTAHLSRLGTEKGEVETQLTSALARATTAEAAVKAASKGEPSIDADTAETLAEGGEASIDGLVRKGNITPKVAASLKAEFVGAAGKRNVKSLSRAFSGGADPIIKRIVTILGDNDPVVLGEQTKAQGRLLSRETPGGGGAEQQATDAEVAEAIKVHTGK